MGFGSDLPAFTYIEADDLKQLMHQLEVKCVEYKVVSVWERDRHIPEPTYVAVLEKRSSDELANTIKERYT